MNASEVLRRLRRFLLALALFIFAGTLLELWLVQHFQDAIQWIAFVLAGIGLLAVLLVLFRNGRSAVFILRVCMTLVILGSLFGIYEHVSNNLAFALEIQPNLPLRELWLKGLGGANPLLAPGSLAIAGLLALAATYKYSVTTTNQDAVDGINPQAEKPTYVESSR